MLPEIRPPEGEPGSDIPRTFGWAVAKNPERVNRIAVSVMVGLISLFLRRPAASHNQVLFFDNYNAKLITLYYIVYCFVLKGR
jgi:hypothetical protein